MEATKGKRQGLKPCLKGARARHATAQHTYTITNTTHKQRQCNIHTQQINNKQSIDKQQIMCYYNNVKRTTHNNKREEV